MHERYTILSIEDNRADFDFIKSALEKIPNFTLDIININNGQSALNFLYKKENFESAPTPHIIILDINLPKIDGKEVLKIIKKDETYKMIPVIILSTSIDNIDIEDTYKLQANAYISKTFDIHELSHKINTMGEFWLKTCELPNINNDNFCHID